MSGQSSRVHVTPVVNSRQAHSLVESGGGSEEAEVVVETLVRVKGTRKSRIISGMAKSRVGQQLSMDGGGRARREHLAQRGQAHRGTAGALGRRDPAQRSAGRVNTRYSCFWQMSGDEPGPAPGVDEVDGGGSWDCCMSDACRHKKHGERDMAIAGDCHHCDDHVEAHAAFPYHVLSICDEIRHIGRQRLRARGRRRVARSPTILTTTIALPPTQVSPVVRLSSPR